MGDARKDGSNAKAAPSQCPHPTKVDWHGGGKVDSRVQPGRLATIYIKL